MMEIPSGHSHRVGSPVFYSLLLAFVLYPCLHGQFAYYESFDDERAEGWELVQDDSSPGPRLTAGAAPLPQDPEFGNLQLDSPGNGWMRLATTTGEQANAVFLDFPIPAAGTRVTATFDFTMWNDQGQDQGGDGLTIFVQDFESNFVPGADGGSMGYAQKVGDPGVPDGYFGVGFDVYGNYSNPTEGRVGGPGFDPNNVTIRGPGNGTSGYQFVAGSTTTLGGLEAIVPGSNDQLDYFNLTSRPDQDAEQYRRARVELDENDVLTVSVEFGYGTGFVQVAQGDLTSFGARPESFRLGFAAGTGGANQVYEIRNLDMEIENGSNAAYWDDEGDNGLWGTSSNWDTDSVPNNHATLFFSDYYATNDSDRTINLQSNRTVGNILLGGEHSYTFTGNTLIMDADTGSSSSAISVMKNRYADADHTIASNISMQNDLDLNQFTEQTLTITGNIATNGHTLDFDTYGTIQFDGSLSGSGLVVKEGPGRAIWTADNDHSGGTEIREGYLRIEHNDALGVWNAHTDILDGGTLELANGITIPWNQTLDVAGTGQDGDGAIRNVSGNNIVAALVDLLDDTTLSAASGSLQFSRPIDTGNSHDLTFDVAEGAELRVVGDINESSGSDTDITLNGGGDLILVNATNYGGLTTINAGSLILQNASGLGTTGSGTVVNDGGTLQFQTSGIAINSSESLTVSGFGDTGKAALWSNVYGAEIDTAITITGGQASFGASAGNSLDLDGGISGIDQDVYIQGDGTVIIKDPTSYTGDTYITSGTLQYGDADNRINDASAIIISSGATYDMEGYDDTVAGLSGEAGSTVQLDGGSQLTFGSNDEDTTFAGSFTSWSATSQIIKEGSGNTILSGTHNGYQGIVRINEGTLTQAAANAFQDWNADLELNGGTFALDGVADTWGEIQIDANSNLDFMGATGGYLTFNAVDYNTGTLQIDNWAGDLAGQGDTQFIVTNAANNGQRNQLGSNATFTGWGTATQWISLPGGSYELVPDLSSFNEWDGSSNDSWNVSANWTNNSVPNATGALAIFRDLDTGLDGSTITLNGDKTVGTLIVDNDDSFTLTGSRLDFDTSSGSAYLTVVGSGDLTIESMVRLADDTRFSNNSTGTVTFDHQDRFRAHLNGGGHTLTLDGSGDFVFSSTTQIRDDLFIIKNGTGTTQLNADNTFSGGFEMNAGLLQLGNDEALGSGNVAINGGSLEAFDADRTLANTWDINNGFTVTGSQALTFSGSGDIAAGSHTITVDPSADFSFTGVVGGSGDLLKAGAGDLYFYNGNNDFSGNITVDAGTLYALETGGGDFTFGSTVAGENHLGTGDTFTVNGGTGGVSMQNGGDVTITSGATLQINGGTGEFWNYDSNTPATTDDFYFAGTANVTGGGELNFGSSRDMTFQSNASLNVTDGTANLYFDDDFATSGTSANPATINVSGNSSVNLYGYAPTGSTVDLGIDDTWNITGPNASMTITQASGSAGQVNLDGTVNLNNGGLLSIVDTDLFLTSDTRINGGTGVTKGTLMFTNDLSVDEPSLSNLPNLTINNANDNQITAPNTGSSLTNVGILTKNGAGTTTLSGNINNIQADSLVINAGTLLLSDDDQIANTTDMELGGGTFATGGNNEILNTLTLTSTSTINLGSGSSVLEFLDSGTHVSGNLEIVGWSGDAINGGGTDQVIFGSTLSSAFLSSVVWKDYYGPGQDASGAYTINLGGGRYEIVPAPIPEPGFYVGGGSLLGFLVWHARRRKRQRAQQSAAS